MPSTYVEMLGFIASGLVFTTFFMKTMIPLRCMAILSNLFFISYGATAGLHPVLFLHVALLPLNIVRLIQMKQLIDRVGRAAMGNQSIEWLVPYMTKRTCAAGATLFKRGDMADDMSLIVRGTIRLVEVGTTVGDGDVLGEIGILSAGGQRTATAVCEADSELMTIHRDKLYELYFQNPEKGLYLVQVLINRLLQSETSLLQSAMVPRTDS
jgi:CRP/FNR family transcriptional regulator, cyclic AMP receptor protein